MRVWEKVLIGGALCVLDATAQVSFYIDTLSGFIPTEMCQLAPKGDTSRFVLVGKGRSNGRLRSALVGFYYSYGDTIGLDTIVKAYYVGNDEVEWVSCETKDDSTVIVSFISRFFEWVMPFQVREVLNLHLLSVSRHGINKDTVIGVENLKGYSRRVIPRNIVNSYGFIGGMSNAGLLSSNNLISAVYERNYYSSGPSTERLLIIEFDRNIDRTFCIISIYPSFPFRSNFSG